MELLIPAAIVAMGGLIKGLNGFGYAVISTSLLATVLPAQEAVAVMILPLIAGNLELVAETGRKELENCLKNFSGFLLSLTAGVTLGMLTLSFIPSNVLKTGVGMVALLFAASRTPKTATVFEKLSDICFRTWEPIIGLLSGTVYGASNIAVPVVAYLESRNLSREKTVGALAIIILGISVYRVLLARYTGLYTGQEKLLLSLLLTLPALTSVWIGSKLSHRFPETYLEMFSTVMIAGIGLKLLLPF